MDISKELKEFKKFKENYQFKQLDLEYIDDKVYCDGLLIKDGEDYVDYSDKWVNVSLSFHYPFSKLLSNLFNYEFEFRGFIMNSLECFFQGIKFKDKDVQTQLFKYSGKDLIYLKETNDYDWRETGIVYWQGEEIRRDSKEYDDLVTELYVSAIQNIFYRNAIKKCSVPIVHIIGKDLKSETVLTRYEFEFMLNCLHEFLNK